MSNRKQGGVVGAVLGSLAVILLIFGILTLTFGLLNKTFVYVRYGDGLLKDGQSLSKIESGAAFGVLGTGTEEYEVTVTALSEEGNNFSFTVAAEPYHWSDLDGRDLTAGFEVIADGSEFRLEFGDMADILYKVYGMEITVTDDAPAGDLFLLTVGGDGLIPVSASFGLSTFLNVGSVDIYPGNVVL